MLCRQGYAATGLNEILEESGAPKGSFYFHFPGGKEQLATEAIVSAGSYVEHMMSSGLSSAESAEHGVRRLAKMFGDWMERSDYREGCPITTVTLETPPGDGELAEACSTAFASWELRITQFFLEHGYPTDRAADLANIVLCTLEGAFVLSRSQMSRQPFKRSADLLVELL